jgi:transposase
MKTICIMNPQDPVEKVLKLWIPASENLELQQLRLTSEELTLVVVSTQSAVPCPICGKEARRVHST